MRISSFNVRICATFTDISCVNTGVSTHILWTMSSIFDLSQITLKKLSTREYFRTIESVIDKRLDVEKLSNFFTTEPYSETKPYLTRRQLIPIDKRFKKIELIYRDKHQVNAVVWDISITLTELTDIFGEPIIRNEPYSDSTAFGFKSKNHNIEIIETRHPQWLTKSPDKSTFEYEDKDKSTKTLIDPEFSFVQFKIAD